MKLQQLVFVFFITSLLMSCNNNTSNKNGFSTIIGTLEMPYKTEINLSKVEHGKEFLVSTSQLNDENQFGFSVNPNKEGFYILGDSDIKNMLSMSDNQYPVYVSDSLLEKTVDRNITELADSQFADVLPEGVENGDVVTNDDFDDKSTFLILNNQKRLFDDIGIFYAEYDVSQLKTIPVSTLDSIPTGEVVE